MLSRNTIQAGIAAFALALAACDDATAPASPRAPSGPQFDVVDAIHNGGAAHFYLLPPLVGEPATAGTFDGSLQPSVEVCELVSGACGPVIAHFSRKGGTGAEAIKVDAGNARYFVNWNTQQCRTGACTLDPAKFYRVRILLAGFELGHADLDVVSRPQDIKNVNTGEFIPLVDGKLLQIRFRLEHGIALVNEAQLSAIAAKFHLNSVRYSDHGIKPATGRSGSASLAARALLNKDGTTDIDVTTGALDDASPPPGNLDHVQLKALKEPGDALWTRNYTNLSAGGSWHESYPILRRGAAFQVQANVSGIDANRTDVVTVEGTVGRRPDLTAENLSNPAQAQVNVGVMISATVRELNGDVGARGNCNLYVDGAKVDQALGIWVDAGDAVSCAFTYRFATTGTKALAVKMEGVVPGDDDLANNNATGSIVVVGGGDFYYSAYAYQYDHEETFTWASTFTETRTDDPTYLNYYNEIARNGYRSDHTQSHSLSGNMPIEVTFPLTRVEVTAASGGTIRHAVVFDDIAADWSSGYSSGLYSYHESCANRFTTDDGGDSQLQVCAGSYTDDGGINTRSWTYFGQWRSAGAATYYSENSYRRIHTPSALDVSYVYTRHDTYRAGTQPQAALGADYTITAVLEDTPTGGSRIRYSANPIIALTEYPEYYNRSWDIPYSCTMYYSTYHTSIWRDEYCSSSKGYQRYNLGSTSGGPAVTP